MNVLNIEVLKGKTIERIQELKIGSGWVYIYCTDGNQYVMSNQYYGSDVVYVKGWYVKEGSTGEILDILNKPIIEATEKVEIWHQNPDDFFDMITWTIFTIETDDGILTIRWYARPTRLHPAKVDFKKIN